jgi:hypothetical protein
MAGFLDAKERVVDMVLTEVGKGLLLQGLLQFKYWIPYDDEVDYSPPINDMLGATPDQRNQQLTESPLVVEAKPGYVALNFNGEDLTNVNRPMYTAPPGMSSPLPRILLNQSVAGEVDVSQRAVTKPPASGTVVERYGSTEAVLSVDYAPGSFPREHRLEGFLVTLYSSSTIRWDDQGNEVGGLDEVLINFDSSGSICYKNDLKVYNYTP